MESCIVIMLLCMVLFGGLQVSRLFMAKEVLDHAAVSGARAAAVGFSDFMVYKTVRVAAIPVAGDLLTGNTDSPVMTEWVVAGRDRPPLGRTWDRAVRANPRAAQFGLERLLIPAYLFESDSGRAYGLLNYADWPAINSWVTEGGSDLLTVRVHQDYPLDFPFSEWIFSGASVFKIRSTMTLENHASLYLE